MAQGPDRNSSRVSCLFPPAKSGQPPRRRHYLICRLLVRLRESSVAVLNQPAPTRAPEMALNAALLAPAVVGSGAVPAEPTGPIRSSSPPTPRLETKVCEVGRGCTSTRPSGRSSNVQFAFGIGTAIGPDQRSTCWMRSSHSLDRVDAAFDGTQLVADAGLLLPATPLALHLGLKGLVERFLDLGRAAGRANVGDKSLTLVMTALAGCDCIDDGDYRWPEPRDAAVLPFIGPGPGPRPGMSAQAVRERRPPKSLRGTGPGRAADWTRGSLRASGSRAAQPALGPVTAIFSGSRDRDIKVGRGGLSPLAPTSLTDLHRELAGHRGCPAA